jgi:hypothetical protein
MSSLLHAAAEQMNPHDKFRVRESASPSFKLLTYEIQYKEDRCLPGWYKAQRPPMPQRERTFFNFGSTGRCSNPQARATCSGCCSQEGSTRPESRGWAPATAPRGACTLISSRLEASGTQPGAFPAQICTASHFCKCISKKLSKAHVI